MLPTPPPSPRLKGAVPSSESLVGHVLPGSAIELQGVLGIGAYGTVYVARDLHTGIDYAVKALNKVGLSPRQENFLAQEIRLHQLASSHPNVVSLIDVIDTIETTFVVLEYCPEGDLFGNITEHSCYVGNDHLAKRIFLQLLDAVEYCHSIGVYHRDLKPENILITDGGMTAKLADFGLACTESCSSDFGCGSTFYMSPECLQASPEAFSFYSSSANDVWSLGVVLVNLTCGRNPWKRASVDDSTFAAYLRDSEFLKTILPLSDELDCILRCIFECDPARRTTIPLLRRMIMQCSAFTTNGIAAAAATAAAATTTVPVEYSPCSDPSLVQFAMFPPDFEQHYVMPQLSHFSTSSGSSASEYDYVYTNPSSTAAISSTPGNSYHHNYDPSTVADSSSHRPPVAVQDTHYASTSTSNAWYSAFMPALDLAQKHLSFNPFFPGMRVL